VANRLHSSNPPGDDAITKPVRIRSSDQGQKEELSRPLAGPWGWLPPLSLLLAVGFMMVALAFRASVSGEGQLDWLYWLGLLLLVVPTAARVAALSASRRERLALVVLLGMALYAVKVMHSPAAFTYTDELVHYANAQQAIQDGRLFGQNSILPVTPNYPGLPAAASAIASLSGLSIFASGILLIGAARLLITLGLFLVYEKLSGSSRLAGLAAIFYMANSNYLYWTAQFAYESLALPLAVFVIFALLMHQDPDTEQPARPATFVALTGLLVVTVTHHLTSYALTLLLGLSALFAAGLGANSRKAKPALWGLALVSLGSVLIWNLVVSPGTYDYLAPVLQRAIGSALGLVTGSGEESTRALFESNTSHAAPLWEQVVGIASVLAILVATPLGLLGFWRRLRWSPLAWVLVLAPLVYLPLQLLRFTGAGWETANRASEFLFVGIAFVIGLALSVRRLVRGPVLGPVVAGLVAGVLFVGGVIAGWPPTLRLAHPYLVELEGTQGEPDSLEPQGVAAAKWARRVLGPGNRMAADNSSARLMQAYGEQYALAGQEFGIRALFVNETIDRGELEIIRQTGVEYLVFPRPLGRWDQMRGLYYNPAEGLTESDLEFLRPGDSDKFDESLGVARLLDTGYIVIYEIGGLPDVAQAP
jgi:hypothetical protein